MCLSNSLNWERESQEEEKDAEIRTIFVASFQATVLQCASEHVQTLYQGKTTVKFLSNAGLKKLKNTGKLSLDAGIGMDIRVERLNF